MRKILFLSALLALTVSVSANGYAQEAPMAQPPAATQALPFVNDGANQPVLQPLSPDGVPVEGGEHGGEHAKSKGLPQFDVTTFPKQLVWLTIVFAFMYLFFSEKTLPTIGSVLTMRQGRIEGDLKSAEDLKNQAENLKMDYEAAIASAQSDAQKLIADIQSDIKAATEKRDAEFKARAEEAVATVEKQIEGSRGRIMGELTTIANDLAGDIAGRITGAKTAKAKAA